MKRCYIKCLLSSLLFVGRDNIYLLCVILRATVILAPIELIPEG